MIKNIIIYEKYLLKNCLKLVIKLSILFDPFVDFRVSIAGISLKSLKIPPAI